MPICPAAVVFGFQRILLQPGAIHSICSTHTTMRSAKRSLLSAVLSDLQFWIPFAVLVFGLFLLRWISQ
jgi:hypothetical protein